MITGFRVARGGVQEISGVDADLTVMGKVLGGGLPLAAYGGRSELMERVAPAGDVYQAGTLSGNPLAVAAGLATLAELDRRRLPAAGEADRDARRGPRRGRRGPSSPGRLRDRARDSLLQRRAAARLRGAAACDLDAYGSFCRALLDRGVYPPPSQFEAWFVSLAHDEAAIERTVSAAAEAFDEAFGR